MMAFLVSTLLIVSSAHAQTSRNCASPDAEVSACPENYLPNMVAPSTGAKQSVINAIAKRNLAVAAEDMAKAKLADLKLAAKDDPEDGDYVKQLQVVQAATKEKYDLSNEAIRLAAVVYNLTPPVPDFSGDPRASVLTTVKPWLPRYSEREKYDEALGRYRPRTKPELKAEAEKSQSVIGGAGSVAAAQTWANGEISMFGQAFNDPDDLAILIYHETSHWVDVAAKPGGGRDSDLPIVLFQSEATAYARSAKLAQQLGRDPTQMLALAAQYEAQAKEVGDRDWAWVLINRRNWLGTDRRGPLAIVPAGPEAASDDETTLSQKMSELQKQVKENREHMERLQKERLEEAARNEELARQEQKKQDFLLEMDAEAASCGYKIRYDADKAMLGFSGSRIGYQLGQNRVPSDFGDLKVIFLMTRTCDEIQSHPHEPAPRACNAAADHLLRERISRGDFMPKLEYLAATALWDGAWVKWDPCIREILNNVSRITDTKSFNAIMTSYQKRESKRLNEEDKRRRDREKREGKQSPGGGSRPPTNDDQDYIWDPGCQCMIRRR